MDSGRCEWTPSMSAQDSLLVQSLRAYLHDHIKFSGYSIYTRLLCSKQNNSVVPKILSTVTHFVPHDDYDTVLSVAPQSIPECFWEQLLSHPVPVIHTTGFSRLQDVCENNLKLAGVKLELEAVDTNWKLRLVGWYEVMATINHVSLALSKHRPVNLLPPNWWINTVVVHN